MKCPVCKTEISESATVCPNCKFDDLQHEFLNAEDAAEWMEEVVLPYRRQMLIKNEECNNKFYNLFSAQINAISSYEKKSRNFNMKLMPTGLF